MKNKFFTMVKINVLNLVIKAAFKGVCRDKVLSWVNSKNNKYDVNNFVY